MEKWTLKISIMPLCRLVSCVFDQFEFANILPSSMSYVVIYVILTPTESVLLVSKHFILFNFELYGGRKKQYITVNKFHKNISIFLLLTVSHSIVS